MTDQHDDKDVDDGDGDHNDDDDGGRALRTVTPGGS